jgi:hypothetical protein
LTGWLAVVLVAAAALAVVSIVVAVVLIHVGDHSHGASTTP